MVGTVDGMPTRGEEDRVRHAGIVPFLGIVHPLHAERRVRATRRRVTRRSRRDVPAILDGAVDGHRHGLARLVDHDENAAERRSRYAAENSESGQQENKKADTLHGSPRWFPHAARRAAKDSLAPIGARAKTVLTR